MSVTVMTYPESGTYKENAIFYLVTDLYMSLEHTITAAIRISFLICGCYWSFYVHSTVITNL